MRTYLKILILALIVTTFSASCSTTTNVYTQPNRKLSEEDRRFLKAALKNSSGNKLTPQSDLISNSEYQGCPCPEQNENQMVNSSAPVEPEAAGKSHAFTPPPAHSNSRNSLSAPSGDTSAEEAASEPMEDFFVDGLPEKERRQSASANTAPTPDESEESFFNAFQSDLPAEESQSSSHPAIVSSAGKPAATEPPDDAVYFQEQSSDGFMQVGTASWYGRDFDGKPTANGEVFDSGKLTAAHRSLPLGSVIMVRNMENGRELVVRVNDRGPYVRGRILDLSEASAARMGFKEKGLTTVGIKMIRPGTAGSKKRGSTYNFYKNYANFADNQDANDPAGGSDSEIAGADSTPAEGDSMFSSIFPDDTKTANDEVSRTETPQAISAPKMALTPPAKRSETAAHPNSSGRRYLNEDQLQGYSVQAGLFRSEYNALELKYRLRELETPIYILRRDDLYVVKIGNFGDREAAEEMKYRLITRGYIAFITDNSY